jgi:hypothetical protein
MKATHLKTGIESTTETSCMYAYMKHASESGQCLTIFVRSGSVVIGDFIQKFPSEADICSASQEIPNLLWNLKVSTTALHWSLY